MPLYVVVVVWMTLLEGNALDTRPWVDVTDAVAMTGYIKLAPWSG
ncbi:hypothetical protein [Mycolicibacterium conceptionense]|nr:hypothetical protein [Mycolicibacterium conceptionense]